MPVRKQTQKQFHQRTRRIHARCVEDGRDAAHDIGLRPLSYALLGAGAALPLMLAKGETLTVEAVAASFPMPVDAETLRLAVAAGVGTALILLVWHGARLMLRRNRASPDSAALVAGAMVAVALSGLTDNAVGGTLDAWRDMTVAVAQAGFSGVMGLIPGLG